MTKKARVAINGFGRIGRIFLREALKKNDLQVVAINDLTDVNTLAHLFKYDSVHGKFEGTLSVENGDLIVNGNAIKVLAERNPDVLPWKSLDIDMVLESTGLFRDRTSAAKHLTAGAKKVVISAPPKSHDVNIYVYGLNEDAIQADESIISNASCTTNSAAHILKLIDDNWGIESGFLTTIHAYTNDQKIHDAPHKDLRRSRAAANSIIPTTTGAAKALIELFPSMKGKLQGNAVRVPVIDGSLTDMTFLLKNETSIDEVNDAIKNMIDNNLQGIIEYTDEPLVSVDILSNPHSAIFDSGLTSISGKLLKVVAWYDNEYGYSARCADLMSYMHKKFEV